MKIDYIVCKICKETLGKNGFGRHLSEKHCLTTKQYYDQYVRKQKEGKCLRCGKDTTFVSITKGYKKYCCIECCNKSSIHKKQCVDFFLKHYGVTNASQVPMFHEKKKVTCSKHNGTEYPIQNEIIRDGIFRNKSKYKGFLSKSEYDFHKKLKKHNIIHSKEYVLENENYKHHFDFAVFNKNGKLKCLVEIDGEFYHGLVNDFDGTRVRDSNDYLRWTLVPKGVKFLIVDSRRLKEGFKELLRILPMKYKDWKREMLNSIPKNIKDAIPKFSKQRMNADWRKLCSYEYRAKSFLGKSILLTFCRSHWDNFDWNSVRKTLYKSPCSIHHLLEGLDSFKNTSQLREKFRKKYRGVKEVIVKHHSPEKMLAICSLGKTYISKEPIDKESIKIIKFLKLEAYQI